MDDRTALHHALEQLQRPLLSDRHVCGAPRWPPAPRRSPPPRRPARPPTDPASTSATPRTPRTAPDGCPPAPAASASSTSRRTSPTRARTPGTDRAAASPPAPAPRGTPPAPPRRRIRSTSAATFSPRPSDACQRREGQPNLRTATSSPSPDPTTTRHALSVDDTDPDRINPHQRHQARRPTQGRVVLQRRQQEWRKHLGWLLERGCPSPCRPAGRRRPATRRRRGGPMVVAPHALCGGRCRRPRWEPDHSGWGGPVEAQIRPA